MKKNSLYYLLALLLLSNCANEIAPTGGTKDTTAPKLVKSSVLNETRNLTARKIVFRFDEFLNYSLNTSQIQVTPEMKPAPKYFVDGKKLTIQLPKMLDSNTTYNIMFGSTIKDINENNPIQDFGFCFSTGDSLDVCRLSGTSISLNDMKPIENIMVGLYASNTDYSKPLYFTSTDKAGNFTFRNIKKGNYIIAAFDDKNLNRIFDKGDGLSGFLDSLIDLKDTLRGVQLNLFPSTKGKIIDRVVPRGNKITIAFTHPIERASIITSPKNITEFAQLNEDRDSLFYWYKNNSADSIELALVINDSTSTIKMKNNSGEDSFYTIKAKSAVKISVSSEAQITFSNPIENIKHKLIKVIEDSSLIINKEKIGAVSKGNVIQVSFPKKLGHGYKVIFEDSTAKDIFGNFSKTDTFSFYSPKEMDAGNLILKFNGRDSSFLIIEVKTDAGVTIAKKYVSPSEKVIRFDGLPVGSYNITGIIDANKNGYWDSGNFEQKIQPEKKVLLKNTITIKGGWDIEAEVNMVVTTDKASAKKTMDTKQ